MEKLGNQWKSSIISDPILTLSNLQSQKYERKDRLKDRFCWESLNKNMFHVQNQSNSNSQSLNKNNGNNDDKQKKYHGMLIETCRLQSKRTIKKNNNVTPAFNYQSRIKRPGYVLEMEINQSQLRQSKKRNFPKQPYLVLDAPKLKDDFYTSLLDWSSSNLISVVLDNTVYLWNNKQNYTQALIEGLISSIKWGKGLVIGEQTGQLSTFDIEKGRASQKYQCHNGRIGTLDCYGNLIVSGSADKNVLVWDIRAKQVIHTWNGHRQEVCGVKWSIDGNMVASGGNDNTVYIWDIRTGKNLCRFRQHKAAVKALAWSPHQNHILSTGGGTKDQTIRTWNINELKCIKKIDTESQVCNMIYSINSNQLVSTHGFSMNDIKIWNTNRMEKVGTLKGHNERVLYLARSPDGQSIITGSGDETLQIWKIFSSSQGAFDRRDSLLQATSSTLR